MTDADVTAVICAPLHPMGLVALAITSPTLVALILAGYEGVAQQARALA